MHKAEKYQQGIKPVWFPAGDRGLLLDLTGYSAQLGGLPPAAERQASNPFCPRSWPAHIQPLQNRPANRDNRSCSGPCQLVDSL